MYQLQFQLKNISSDVFVKSAVESFLNCSKPGDVIILESSIEVGTTEIISNIIKNRGFEVGKEFLVYAFVQKELIHLTKEWGIEKYS